MLDTMTLTKAVSGLCGAFLIFLLGKWAAEEIYHVGGHGHGDDHAQAYTIEVAEDDTGADAEPAIPFAEILATADAAGGEKGFNKCVACHKAPGENATGPTLVGVFERDIASLDGFAYSSALTELSGTWTPEALNAFLESPKGYAPGTKMTFNGFRKVEDRADMVAYLQTLSN